MKKLAAFAALCLVVTFLAPGRVSAQEEPPAEEPPAEDEGESTAGAPAEAAPEGEDEDEEPSSDPEETPDADATLDVETYCTDGVDDDGDGDVDCDDYDCLEHDACLEDDDDEGTTPTVSLSPTGDDEDGEDDEEEDDLLDVEEPEDDEPRGWRERALDMFELHGYLRVRADLFHVLHMHKASGAYYDAYRTQYGIDPPYPYRPNGVGTVECGEADGECGMSNNTYAGANMRFRLEPIINLGDQVRILAQIDLLDNLVLGSTPEGSYFEPSGIGGQSPWVPLRFFNTTQVAPSERNSLTNAVSVRRAWAEVTTPFGQLHFGRMGSHWGLGMLANSGNQLDDDYGDTVDRVMLAARLWGMLLIPGVEFAGQGPTSALWGDDQGQPMDAGQLDDVAQYFLVIARQLQREEQEERLRRGDLVINGGLYFLFQNQVLSQERVGAGLWSDETAGESGSSEWTLRNAWAVIPDLWFQLYYRGFHLELEFAYIGGQIENTEPEGYDADSDVEIRQFGGVIRGDYTALGGQLNVGLEFGYASGDAEIEGLSPYQTHRRLQQADGYAGSNVDSLFRFDPDFNIDLILFEQVLGQIAGAYYVRPWVQYEFINNMIGIRGDIIYSLASEPMSTIGNSPHLGVEIDVALWYRAPAPHNFYAMLQYGVLFPLGAWEDPYFDEWEAVDYPQTVQAMLAVPY